jgi:hypothetical protein
LTSSRAAALVPNYAQAVFSVFKGGVLAKLTVIPPFLVATVAFFLSRGLPPVETLPIPGSGSSVKTLDS